jgi:ABC-type sugar transport system ATPase subunit
MSAHPGPLLELKAITKTFGATTALDAASFEGRAGEVHALMGANGAGKSTLMNVLGGVVAKDEGEIVVSGVPVQIRSPHESKALGIAFVQQELNMLPTMTVAENVFIDALPQSGGLIDRERMRARGAELLERLGSRFAPDQPVEELSTGDRQMVEIARALARDPRIIIFDEPTSSLTDRERQRLFAIIRQLKASGAAVIYITHFLDEIFHICDRVTVMRNGQTVGSSAIAAITPTEVVRLMLGEVERQERLREPHVAAGKPLLSVRGLNRRGVLHDIGFDLYPGEIVGLWGLLGSGRTELVHALIGLDPIDSGELHIAAAVGDRPIAPAALHREIGLVTEDRRGEGLLMPLSVVGNLSLASLGELLTRLRLIDRRREQAFAEDIVARLKIKLNDVRQPVKTLSGGNQQKVVLGRWLATRPRLFFLDEPTRGLDVAAKAEVLRLTAELAAAGASILLISSELEDMMRVCDRYLVISRGRITGELPGGADKNRLMEAVSGHATAAAA